MMLYQMKDDGSLFRADTAEELVRQLHEVSLAPAEDDETWMSEVADRTMKQTGRHIRSDNAAAFVADLLKIGLIKEVDEKE